MNNKTLFLDLDGTLLWPATFDMPESTRIALEQARANGHRMIICTGRNLGFTRPVLKYGFDGIIGSAGGYVQIGDQILNDFSIPSEEAQYIIRILKENGFALTVETKEHMIVDEDVYPLIEKITANTENSNSELARLRRQADEALHFLSLQRDYHGEPICKILLLCQDHSQFEIPEKLLGDRYYFIKHAKDSDGIVNGEIISRNVSKGKALEMVTEYLKLPLDETIAFGDSMNDVEMFHHAGFSVCMGNGPDNLKQMVDYVCPRQDEDGLYHAFKHLGLI